MGLLDKVKKKKLSLGKIPEPSNLGLSSIKRHAERKIKKQESVKFKEPTAKISPTGVSFHRPKGSLSGIKETAKYTNKIKISSPEELQNLKKEIVDKLKGNSNSDKPKNKSSDKKSPANFNLKAIKEEIERELKGAKKQIIETDPHDRIKTGIHGLDGVMSGGFRRDTVNLLVGGPGSGKSTFAMQFLVNGVNEYDEPGVYISFEQTDKEIIKDFAQFGWDLQTLVDNKKLIIITYSPEQIEKILETGGGSVRDIIETMKAKRIVIDSLTAYTLLHHDALAQRKACIELFEAIKKWDCTALLVAEQEPDPEKRHPSVEEFEVDGVVLLYNMRRGDVRERALEIFKMRGTKHSAKLFPMMITDEGVVIYPEQTVF
jgi:KaiC/GvpD/RAD55 family RecA-like ATPase